MPPTLGGKKNIRTLMNGTEGTNSSFLWLPNESAHPKAPLEKWEIGRRDQIPTPVSGLGISPLQPGPAGCKDSSHGTAPTASIAGV